MKNNKTNEDGYLREEREMMLKLVMVTEEKGRQRER